MGKIKTIKKMIKKYIGITFHPVEYYRSIGVNIEDGVTLTGAIHAGTEPWLITIKKNALITSEVVFLTHDGSVSTIRRLDPKYERVMKFGHIIVDEGAFIGLKSTIMPSVHIGKNAIIAACSCVTKDVPDGEVWGGVPAKKICTVEELAEKMLLKNPEYKDWNNREEKIIESKKIADSYWNNK